VEVSRHAAPADSRLCDRLKGVIMSDNDDPRRALRDCMDDLRRALGDYVGEDDEIERVAWEGWQCPVCMKVWAPWVAACDCHSFRTSTAATQHYYETA